MLAAPGRRALLTVHVIASLGWLGALAAFIVLDVATVASGDPALLRAAYIGMDLITRWAIVPMAVAALLSGIVIAVATPWGLFRHWWVVVTLVLTAAATIVLLVQLPTVAHRAAEARDPATTEAQLAAQGDLLLHSIGGAAVLTVVTALNVVKPRGLTRHGWRLQQAEAGRRPPS